MNTLQLIETKQINNVSVDGWYGTQQAWFTRTQIGQALEYSNPENAITIIHRKHKKRLDLFSFPCQFDTGAGRRTGYVYNLKGVLEICRWSKQPKADIIMDALYDMAMEVMEKGYYSTLPDNQLLNMLSDRLRENPKLISDTTLSERQKNSLKVYDMEEQIRQLWEKRSDYDANNYNRELARICNYSVSRYNREWQKYVRWSVSHTKNQAEASVVSKAARKATDREQPFAFLKGMIPLSDKKE